MARCARWREREDSELWRASDRSVPKAALACKGNLLTRDAMRSMAPRPSTLHAYCIE
jgi:hypothetical protein